MMNDWSTEGSGINIDDISKNLHNRPTKLCYGAGYKQCGNLDGCLGTSPPLIVAGGKTTLESLEQVGHTPTKLADTIISLNGCTDRKVRTILMQTA